MNTGHYFRDYCHQLEGIYAPREAEQIAHLVFEHFTGMTRTDRILQREQILEPPVKELLDKALQELLRHRPVQYVIGETWFCGLRFKVNENVLIPRPETEELVEWIKRTVSGEQQSIPGSGFQVTMSQSTTDPPNGSPVTSHRPPLAPHRSPGQPCRVLDIGTGSGCIAIALKKQQPVWAVCALDHSEAALTLARENARINNAEIEFVRADILDLSQTATLPRFDIIVSNPPYIPLKEKTAMQRHVTDYEPAGALFVPDEAPLLFYRAIADLAREKLNPGGQLFFEINESFGKEVAEMLTGKGFSPVEIRSDLSGKERMVSGEN